MPPGKLGRFEIREEIARGAMGVVYKAFDPVLGRTVAIKTIGMSRDSAERADYEARFYQEARAAGALAHPNIVTIYDIGDSGSTAYMAMEFLEGRELDQHFGEGRAAPMARAIDIAAQIACGLAYAHSRGVIHRDVKPANIMVLEDGLVKITDFGIARMRSSEVKTQTGLVLGSPRYMPPETFLGKRADHRSDIFSLGVILYEMLTAAAPFTGESVNALMYQTINFVPPAPGAIRPEVPPMLDFIVAKTLAKDPEDRYQSAKDLERDLRECERQMRDGRTPVSDARRPPASIADGASAVLADTNARDDLIERTQPLTRTGDSLADATPPAATLGVSRAFDSMAATQRMAELSGMRTRFSDEATTIKMPLPSEQTLRMRHRPAPAGRERWTPREIAIFAAGVVVALVVAVAIALGKF